MAPDTIASPRSAALPSPAPLLERTIGPDWRCLTDAEIRVGGESGPVDLLALHPKHGAVLVALLRKGETASPEEAVAALRAMLDELGFATRFPGELRVAAVAHELGRRDRLAEAVRAAAGDAPESPPDAAWMNWLVERVAAPARTELRLVVPPASEEPPPPTNRLEAPRERILPEPPRPNRESASGTAFALLGTALVIAVLAGLAYLWLG